MRVVALERLPVVVAFVAEQRPAVGPGLVAGHEQRLEVVAELVAQMTEHRPVGLAEVEAPRLAPRVVGLGQVDRDQPVGVAGGHRLVLAGEQVEGQLARARRPAARARAAA